MSRSRLIIIFFAGIIGYMGLKLGGYGMSITFAHSGPPHHWYQHLYIFIAPIIRQLFCVIPGFLVGWLVGRKGFILGALIGALGSFAFSIFLTLRASWTFEMWTSALALLNLGMAIPNLLADAIISAVSGAAGQLFRISDHMDINS